ncbi:hypothetical protein HZ326_3202 [Fusarium oxysporum f. sp. albedinis]|nr:hypothetical protein HZ326_3202 [Fusarium oxysporum f. sp. albedinis]
MSQSVHLNFLAMCDIGMRFAEVSRREIAIRRRHTEDKQRLTVTEGRCYYGEALVGPPSPWIPVSGVAGPG